MLRSLYSANDLWAAIVLMLVKDLARNSADEVAEKYVKAGVRLVKQSGAKTPKQVVRVTLDMVEDKQGWSNLLVKLMLRARGMTRSQAKAKFAEAALMRIKRKELTDPEDIVAETVAVVREKQGWDKVTEAAAAM